MDIAGRGRLWIGTSGWSYDDWKGVVYPRRKPRGFKPLAYLARFINAVEVNTSFYRIPTARMTSAWVPQVPAEFRFAFKLTQAFTHQRDEYPPPADVKAFTAALEPIEAAGLLGPLLMQFPWSFRYTSNSVDWLRRLADSFPSFERFVEVRHSSWSQPEALGALREYGGYCNIDQPGLPDCLGPSAHVFGPNAYVRLHGRNADKWFAQTAASFERYNYLYNTEELRAWVERVGGMLLQAGNVYVFTNNHYYGQSLVNALELKAQLEDRLVAVPDVTIGVYPRLESIAQPMRQGDNLLF